MKPLGPARDGILQRNDTCLRVEGRGRAKALGKLAAARVEIEADAFGTCVPDQLHQKKTDRAQADHDHDVGRLESTSFHRAHAATQRLHERGLTVRQTVRDWKGDALDVLHRHTNKFSEPAWIEIGFLKLRAHRNIPMATVMTLKTGHVVSHDHTIPDVKSCTLRLHHTAGHLVAQNNRVFQRLKTNLVNIRKTNSTGRDLQEKIALL